MLTIETKPGVTLHFLQCPDGYEHIALVVPEGSRFGWKGIGRLSEITEEQAKELVDGDKYVYKTYGDLPECAQYGTQDLKGGGVKKFALYAVDSLGSAAIGLGIKEEDFDQYLVIKL